MWWSGSRRNITLIAIGCGLICALIWYGGPRVAFGLRPTSPLAPESARYVAMAAVIGVALAIWGVWLFLRWVRTLRDKRALRQSVARKAQPPAPQPSSSPEITNLREQFEDGIRQQPPGRDLYGQPWYLLLGAGGSGKTTLLRHSGAGNPNDRSEMAPTRGCRWGISDEAAFLDTAGRYTAQTDETDRQGWTALLELLRKYRPIRPLNGAIVAVELGKLIGLDSDEQASVIRRRLIDLNATLGQDPLPVYLVVTKCDQLPGFAEFLEDPKQKDRVQALGTAFPVETPKTTILDGIAEHLDRMLRHLNARLFERTDAELGWRHNEKIVAFLQAMTALRTHVDTFAREAFASMRYEQDRILLRGIYFTGATSDDGPAARPAAGGRLRAVKWSFAEGVLREVVLSESGLAGVNPFEQRKRVLRWLGYAAAIFLAGIVVSRAFFVSHGRNVDYVAAVRAEMANVGRLPRNDGAMSLRDRMIRLDAMRRLDQSANRYRYDTALQDGSQRTGTPVAMRWGLYQGTRVGGAARDVYVRELNRTLLPVVGAQIVRGLVEHSAVPEKLYDYLKAYLMLGEPERLDKDHVRAVGLDELRALSGGDQTFNEALEFHYRSLLDYQEQLPRMAEDQMLVEQGRRAIQGAQIAQLMYGNLTRKYSADRDDPPPLLLTTRTGMGAERYLRLRDRPLKTPVASLYTGTVFKNIVGSGTDEVVRRFYDDQWVWGEGGLPAALNERQLRSDLIAIYKRDYIAFWEGIIREIEPRTVSDPQGAAELLDMLGSRTGPLLLLLRTVDEQTHLTPPNESRSGLVGKVVDAKDRLTGIVTGQDGLQAIAEVTNRFTPIHQLVSGQPAPIDGILSQLQAIQEPLRRIGAPGSTVQSNAEARSEVKKLGSRLRQDAAVLPDSVATVVNGVVDIAEKASVGSGESGREWREVVERCQAVTRSHYPFVAGSPSEILLSDFGSLFGQGGTYDTFFRKIETMLDIGGTWRWKANASLPGVSVARLEQADRIRRLFFPSGGRQPQFSFTLDDGALVGELGADRFELRIHGQSYAYLRNSPPPSVMIAWPGPALGAAMSFGTSGSSGSVDQPGAWAWFRLMEQFQRQAEGNGRYKLRFALGGRTATIRIQTATTNDPFAGLQMLRQFGC